MKILTIMSFLTIVLLTIAYLIGFVATFTLNPLLWPVYVRFVLLLVLGISLIALFIDLISDPFL